MVENIVLGFSPQHSSMFLQRANSWNSEVKYVGIKSKFH